MNKDKYNYLLNGIEHEIILNDCLKIEMKPLNDKILVSNKYIIKYINDLFDFYSIEYCIISDLLLGYYIFNGINIFNAKIEIGTLDINFFKINKIEEEIIKDGFILEKNNNYIKISCIFFNNIKVSIFIYPFESSEDILKYNNLDNTIILHEFYDIFPIKKVKFEEFEVSVPNKIEKVLLSYNINLNYIIFSNKKKDKKLIIEENDKKSFNTIINDNINNIISTIKPIFF